MATMTEPQSTTDRRIDDLRAEMHQGFARIDADLRELRAGDERLRTAIKEGDDGLRAAVKEGDDELRAAIKEGDDELRTAIKEGDDGLRTAIKEGDDALRAEIGRVNSGLEDLRTLMIRFFAGTLGSIIAGVVLLLLTHS